MLHVDDAVEAFLAAGATPMPPGVTHGSFNIGGTRPIPLRDVCQAVLRAGSTPEKAQQVHFAPFPSDRKRIDIGSYHANDQKFRQWTGWKPVIEFEDGIVRTVLFYRSHAAEYLPCIDSAL
jgi:UDP-glucose 4-epimerase